MGKRFIFFSLSFFQYVCLSFFFFLFKSLNKSDYAHQKTHKNKQTKTPYHKTKTNKKKSKTTNKTTKTRIIPSYGLSICEIFMVNYLHLQLFDSAFCVIVSFQFDCQSPINVLLTLLHLLKLIWQEPSNKLFIVVLVKVFVTDSSSLPPCVNIFFNRLGPTSGVMFQTTSKYNWN